MFPEIGRAFLAILLGLLGVGCNSSTAEEPPTVAPTRALARFETPPAPVGPRMMQSMDKKASADMPATVELILDESTQSRVMAALDQTPVQTVRLAVRGVTPPADESVTGFRIFLNKPKASATTHDDDPHFVAAVVFQ